MGEISREFEDFPGKSALADSRERLLEGWVVALTLGAAGLCVGLLSAGYRVRASRRSWLCLPPSLSVAEHESISLGPAVEVTIASLVCVFAAVVLGPISGAVIAVVGLLRDLPRRDTERPILRWATWTSIRVIATASAGLAAAAIGRRERARLPGDLRGCRGGVCRRDLDRSLADVCCAGDPADEFVSSLAQGGRSDGSWRACRSTCLPWRSSPTSMASPRGVWRSSPSRHSRRSACSSSLPPAARDARSSGEANARLASANLSFATALVATLDARDRYTAGHSTAVAIYATDIAKRMGLPERDQELVHLCGLVHDVGKIGLPASVLEKPGALSLEERREMERHSDIGEEILRNVDDYGEIAGIVRSHHERVDGTGYPDQLVGDEIPLARTRSLPWPMRTTR